MQNFGQCEIGNQTEKAIQINLETATGADRWVWFPKSVVQIDKDHVVYVKTWFCTRNRIWPVTQRA